MKRLEFETIEDFIYHVVNKFDEIHRLDGDNDISIIVKYYETKEIVQQLICIGCEIKSINELSPYDTSGYNDEFIISLCEHDGTIELYCEPMLLDDGEYLFDESTVQYIFDNCSSKVLESCEGKHRFEVCIQDEEDCCDCDKVTKKDKAITTTSTSSYTINGRHVTKEEFDKKCAEFENKYFDNVRDILLNYCEFLDEMNEWVNLLGR